MCGSLPLQYWQIEQIDIGYKFKCLNLKLSIFVEFIVLKPVPLTDSKWFH